MLKMVWAVFNLFFLFCFLGLTGAGQESTIQLLTLYDATVPGIAVQAMSQSGYPLAVSVTGDDMNGVSSSVLKAESWLRTHVLARFPGTKITTILVGNTILCKNGQDHNLGMVLPSLKNIHYSLTRWGLDQEIEVSAAFPSDCFNSNSVIFSDDLVEKFTKPILQFLQSANSTCSIYLPPNFSPDSDEYISLISSHVESLEKFASLSLSKINVVVINPKQQTPMNRKHSTRESETVFPFPARPTPLPETPQLPLHSSIGFSVPSSIAKNPHPPLPLTASPPPLSFPHASPPPMAFPFPPEQQPGVAASAPYGYSLPPCIPVVSPIAPAPEAAGVLQELWCVAKPSVPAETLQEAMDYACGEGGADCAEIMPHGTCFYPDTVVAHASYAFNSYFQKNKRNGGTCNFAGTAMLISSDPSFLHCRFLLS